MLISCPECGVNVSEKAPTCPKCGALIAYLPFYSTVERDGLNISSLLCDWWNENLDDSAFGSLQPISSLHRHTDDEEMVELTWTGGRKLAELMENRVAVLPKKSAEAIELKLAATYVRIACQFANLIRQCFHREEKWSTETIRSELDSIIHKLENLKASCKDTKDISLLSSEMEWVRKFGGEILTRQSTTPPAPPPVSSLPPPKSSGCIPLLVVLLLVVVGLGYAGFLLK